MKYRIGWLMILTIVLIFPSLVSNRSSSASSKQDQALRTEEDAKPPVDDSYVSPGNRHKVQVNDLAYARQLQKQGARLLAEYEDSAVVEVNSETAKELKASSRGVNRDEYNLVMLNAGYIDTTTPQGQELSVQSVGKIPSGKHMRLVQFASSIKPEWYDAMVDAGLEVVTYMPTNAYLVYGDSRAMNRFNRFAQRSGVVQWQGGYHEVYKIDPRFQVEQQDKEKDKDEVDTQSKEEDKGGNGLYTVQLYKNSDGLARTMSVIDQLKDGEIKVKWDILNYTNLIVPLSDEDVKSLATAPEVVVIERFVEPKKLDERQNRIISGQLTGNAPTPGDWLAYLAGKGFTQAQFTASNFSVNVVDSGVDDATTSPNHFALYTSGNTTLASRVVFNRLSGTPNGGSTLQGCDGHGNINAHIVAGFVPTGAPFNAFPHADASGFRYGLGVAPFVKVGSSVIFDPDTFTFPNYANLESMAYQDGSRISTNSWGGGFINGTYSTDSQTYDALVRDSQPAGSTFPTAGNQEMVIIFAAGNDGPGAGSVASPSTAKNVITVGASENVQSLGGTDFCGIGDTGSNSANDIIGFSGRGPCLDQRRKPDIMAPGTHVTGGVFQEVLNTNPVSGNGDAGPCFDGLGVCAGVGSNFFPLGQQFYTSSDGTSHSTPAVSGGAALLRQFFINNAMPSPSPAMTKGVLMAHASRMTGVGANDTLWSNNQGMGLMNLDSVFDIFTTPTILRDQVAADTFTATGQTRVITGNINSNSKPFIVALTYTDAPGPTSGNAFVNNLDLEVTVGGNTYKGNVFSGGNSTTGGTADTRNNAEFVKIPAGVTGPFVVTVRATNIAGNGVPNVGGALDQDYALMIYNANEVAQAVMAPAGATLVSESCAPANGAIDPGETVTVSLCVQNIGILPTTNLVGTLQATGGVQSPSGPQSYGAVAAGGSPVCRNFTFVANGTCGGTITATLQLQDGAQNLGTVTFTFTLGTTALNPPMSFSNAASIAIPGTSTSGPAAPYPSTINVAGLTGLVSKVTATLTNINHTFPDDIDILLVGPAGQKILLMSDVGASLDLVNTTITFDDAAASGLPDFAQIVSGTFRPTNIGVGDTFPAPAPADPYGAALADFNGTNPNGTWSLFVFDDLGGDTGNIAGGWSLTITTAVPVCCSQPCMLTCANITVSNDPNQCTAVVTYSPTVSGICGTVSCSPASGSTFPVGTTTVTCTPSMGMPCSFTVTVNDTQFPSITCPQNITVSNDPDQCGAIVTYPSPAVSDNCPIVSVFTCDPPSGNFFPVGTTTVTCSVTDIANNTTTCPFTITVNDTQPPEIECPANVTAVTAIACPPAAMTTVTFPPPTATDNCPGVTTACVPPSGSMLPVGTSTVTCTATDASGNTDTCSFTITVFNARIQDDSNPANVILFNTFTGDYRACCGGMVFTGVGTVTAQGCDFTLQHNPATYRVLAKWSSMYLRGSGSVQSPPGTLKCTITDRDIRNNTSLCP